MIGLLTAIVIFNILAYKTNKDLTRKEIAHIWCFTIAFQAVFDTYIDIKYNAYWYFSPDVDWISLPAVLLLLPPVNHIFINWYPFKRSIGKQIIYFLCWEVVLLAYELLTQLPQPWGYFYYGWWNLGYSVLLNPILLLIVVFYYKRVICKDGEEKKWAN
ncbi:hypothetical protein KO561_04945 [Radiobacillus kanasensis]|uniref:hypothetical protein n=1 Tax=Radiobacillus kanasensis TaxID=2844358 RepID=UPI001E43945E|nr:hypothetical protein [Radiobacillus kanasensis]UFU00302.1 hypothetical protein KO561_04945 [Radiobacillus kanasensis]